MSEDKVINLVSDFSQFPGGRSYDDGPNSGQRFLDEFLMPAVRAAMKNGTHVVIGIDGVAGLPPSFLEEAFGGLLRSRVISLDDALRIIRVSAHTDRVRVYPDKIVQYMRAAAA